MHYFTSHSLLQEQSLHFHLVDKPMSHGLPFHALYPRSQLCFQSLRSRPQSGSGSAVQRLSPHPVTILSAATSPLLTSVVHKEMVFLNMNVNPYIQNSSTPPITSYNLLHVWPLEISFVLSPGTPSSRLSS